VNERQYKALGGHWVCESAICSPLTQYKRHCHQYRNYLWPIL